MSDDKYKQIFSQNLRYYMSLNNKEQIDLINDLGFNKSAVSTWCNGTRLPRMDKVNMLAEYFNINRSDLIEERLPASADDLPSSDQKQRSKGIVIKVYGRVAAGIPIEMIEDVIDTEEIPEDMAKTGSFFGLLIKGDSMLPNICDGDTVIIRCQEDAENGDTVIVTVNGNDATCKRLRKYKDGIELVPNNPAYDPIYFSNKDIIEKPVRILGKVVELRRKF